MKRISGFILLLICLFWFPSFSQSQTLNRAPVSSEKETTQAPILHRATPAPASPAIQDKAADKTEKALPPLNARPRGRLIRQGNRLFFRLDRPTSKMDVYAGKRKLGQLGGGLQFDLTPYLDKAHDDKLTLLYVDATGRQYKEEIRADGSQAPIKPAIPKMPTPQPGLEAPQPPPSNLGTIIFQSPKTGDYLFQGTDYEIKLQGQGYIPEPCYGLYLYQGSTQVMHIVLQKCGPTYLWHVPAALAGTDFRIRLVTLDSRIMAESAPFPILSNAPDLSVTNAAINPSSPDTADTITFRATVANGGLTQADGVRAVVTITAPDNAETTYAMTLPRMALGDHHLVEKSFRLPKAGPYTVSLTAEVTLSTALETRLDNNMATIAFPVTGLPDLRVCMHQIRNVQIDHWEYIDVKVENIGEATSSSTTLNIWIDGRGTETIHVPGLIPGSHNMGQRYEMWISRNPSRDYWAEVDPGNTVRESDEDNNRMTGVIVKHLSGQPDTNYRCAGFSIPGYPVYAVP